ncbi:hypothetical protein UY3_01859 [Chelonia mydas]|uniref:C-type lectin domain-containing protein n=1 Tax=Chelonia mydas TaxID=8469 RepID=M7C8H6_CHEMY|nr:hypothetical protein UY3_01859 [Chelonia mydas]
MIYTIAAYPDFKQGYPPQVQTAALRIYARGRVMKRNRRHTLTKEDCVVAFKQYLSPADCSSLRKWICKREGDVNLFTMHKGRALYSPYVSTSSIYNTLKKATDTCSVLQTCTGIVAMGEHYILQSGMELYNSRNSSVKSFIKSDCISGRFGLLCEFKCPPCEQGMACNPYTGLCGDTVFCSKENSLIPCGKGSLTAVSCFRKALWICKRKEEGIVDFREFQGYYLAGTYTSDSTQQSLWEALQLCRVQRSICNGVGMIKGEYRTIFATRILLIIGALGDESTAYLKSRVINMKCPEDPGWWYWNGSCYYMEETNSLTWLEAKNYCTAYNGTDLLLLDSAEEKRARDLTPPFLLYVLGCSHSSVAMLPLRTALAKKIVYIVVLAETV